MLFCCKFKGNCCEFQLLILFYFVILPLCLFCIFPFKVTHQANFVEVQIEINKIAPCYYVGTATVILSWIYIVFGFNHQHIHLFKSVTQRFYVFITCCSILQFVHFFAPLSKIIVCFWVPVHQVAL